MVVGQAFSNEVFAAVSNRRLGREEDLLGIEDGLVAHYSHLCLIMTEGLYPKDELKENNSYTPDVDLNRENG
jgi:hypothetical protein